MKKLFYLFLAMILWGEGCATGKPMIWIEKGVSLSRYKVLEVAPITNDTGKTYDFDVADTLTKTVKANLAEKGYVISEGGAGGESVLELKGSLTLYEPGSALQRWFAAGLGTTQCNVKVSLIDKKTGKLIGETQVAKAISEGGLYSIGADKRILTAVADDIVDAVDSKMKEKKE
jgi:hypothetical protein